jgi:hypothetical protein
MFALLYNYSQYYTYRKVPFLRELESCTEHAYLWTVNGTLVYLLLDYRSHFYTDGIIVLRTRR